MNAANSAVTGIYSQNITGVYYYNNTIVLDDQLAEANFTRGFYIQGALDTNIRVYNNIVYVTRSGTGQHTCITITNASIPIKCDNNVYYFNPPDTTAANTGLAVFGQAAKYTLAIFQAANPYGYDLNSVSANPVFASPLTGNFTPTNIATDNIGANVGVTTDLTGASRSVTTPDAGAIEFNIIAPPDISPISLVSSGTTSGCYTAGESITVRIKNYGGSVNFSTTPTTITCNVTGTSSGTFTGSPSGILNANGTQDVILTGTLDMSINGTYNFKTYTALTGDIVQTNDTLLKTVVRANPVGGTITSNPDAYCGVGGKPVLTLSGNAGGNIQWQVSTTSAGGPWTNVGAGTNPYTADSIIQKQTSATGA